MGNRRIAPETKERALELWKAGFSKSDICFIFIVSRASLYRWAKIFEEFGTANKPPSPLRGRPRLICLAALTAVKELYEQHPDTYIDELQWFLAIHHDIPIAKSSLQENLAKAGLTRKRLHKIAKERDEARRAEFLECIQNDFIGDGSEFVAIDESSKNEHDVARRYGRLLSGTPADYSDPFIRGVRYSLVAAMTKEGYLAAKIVEGSLDAHSFFDFVVNDVIPQVNPFPDARSVLVMDNCRIHRNDTLQEVLNDCGIMLLYLPPYSPDLNPIEESFGTWKYFLRRNNIQIRQHDDPVLALLESTSVITPDMAESWFIRAGYVVQQ